MDDRRRGARRMSRGQGELLARARKAGRSPDDLGALLEEPIDRTVTPPHRDTEPRDAQDAEPGHVAFLFAAHRAVVDVDVTPDS